MTFTQIVERIVENVFRTLAIDGVVGEMHS